MLEKRNVLQKKLKGEDDYWSIAQQRIKRTIDFKQQSSVRIFLELDG